MMTSRSRQRQGEYSVRRLSLASAMCSTWRDRRGKYKGAAHAVQREPRLATSAVVEAEDEREQRGP
jgi:hypothetical protein